MKWNKKPKTYAKISLETRKRIVEMIQDEGKNQAETAEKLNISVSTVKLIYRRYREGEGFFQSKTEKFKRQLIQSIQKKEQETKNTSQGEPNPQPQITYVPIYVFVPIYIDSQANSEPSITQVYNQ